VRQRRTIEPLGFDTQPGKLLVLSNQEGNFTRVLSFDLATRKFDAEPLFGNDKYDISGVMLARAPDSSWQGPVGLTVAGPAVEQVFVDEFRAGLHATLKRSFPGAVVTLSHVREKQGLAILTVEGPARPPEYYLVRAGEKVTLSKLGAQRPWLDPASFGTTTWVSYAARDGMNIPAILTTPPGWKRATSPCPRW